MKTALVWLIVIAAVGAAIFFLGRYLSDVTTPTLGLEEIAQPEFIKSHPEKARRTTRDLLEEALDARAAGEEADDIFENACHLARAISRHLDDPSVAESCAFYQSLDRAKVVSKRQADQKIEELEKSYISQERDDSEALADELLTSYENLSDLWGKLRVMHLLGNISLVSSDMDSSKAHYEQVVDSASRIGDRYREAAAVNNLARIEEWQGNIREAESGYRFVGELGDRHGLARIKGFALFYQGNLLHRLGIPERAVGVLQQAAMVFHDLNLAHLEAQAANSRGASLQRMGLHDEALHAYQHSLALRTQSGNASDRLAPLLNIAELHYEVGDVERAMGVLNEILSLTIGAADAASRRLRWGALVTATDIHLAVGRFEEARTCLEEAEAIAEDVGHALHRVELDTRRAELFRRENDPEKAVEVLENAVAVIERIRMSPEAEEERVRFLGAQNSVFKDLAGIYLRRLDRPEAAFDILEKSRSRAFLDSLEGGAHVSGDESEPRVLLVTSAQTADLLQVESHLPSNAALLHYTVAPRWLAVMVLDSRGRRSHAVIDVEQGEIENLASSFIRHTSGEAVDRGIQDIGEKLSRLLLGPYSDLDGEYEALVIVPDGILFSIPWSALPFRGGHLVDNHVISIEPSASVFVHLNGRPLRKRSPTALLVANPPSPNVVGGAKPRPLPEAEREAAELERLLSRTTILVGEDASEGRVREKAGEHDIIHFGTHAWIVTENPLRSSLLLAGTDDEVADPHLRPVAPSDGILTGYEVLGLEMKPQTMVTLAACESVGRGRGRGEGVAGLARAFFEAGAGTVIATLWPVDDRSTRELMVRFYRELTFEGKSTAAALAAAQAALSQGEAGKRRQHPFNWAGFVLIGDGR